jgi:hypothetical protein
MARKLVHRSIDYPRVECNWREQVFADAWEKENEAKVGCGPGLLFQLLNDHEFEHANPIKPKRQRRYLGQNEAEITATAIQWLGSNVGMAFVEKCLLKCGYIVSRDPKFKPGCRSCMTPEKQPFMSPCKRCGMPISIQNGMKKS